MVTVLASFFLYFGISVMIDLKFTTIIVTPTITINSFVRKPRIPKTNSSSERIIRPTINRNIKRFSLCWTKPVKGFPRVSDASIYTPVVKIYFGKSFVISKLAYRRSVTAICCSRRNQ